MLRSPTTLIIGAGSGSALTTDASLRMPMGIQLIEEIRALMKFEIEHFGHPVSFSDDAYHKAIIEESKREKRHISEYYNSMREIRDALQVSSSIDDYLRSNYKNPVLQKCAKMAIARIILKAEAKSALRALKLTEGIKYPELPQCWLLTLVQKLNQGSSHDNPEGIFKNLSIINYNYDRCVEIFFVHAIANRFHLKLSAAAQLVKQNLNIVHPFGTVGSLWEDTQAYVFFGNDNDQYWDRLSTLADEIITFGEQRFTSNSREKIEEMCKTSEVFMFMGLGYHEPNIEPLVASDQKNVKIYGTAIGVLEEDRKWIMARLINKLSKHISDGMLYHNDDCASLIKRHSQLFR